MMRRRAIVSLLVLNGMPAPALADVRIGVFGLFHPKVLVVGAGDGRSLTVRSEREACAPRALEEVRVTVSSGLVRADCAGRVLRAHTLRLASPIGGVTDIELSVPGRINRKFRGQIDVTTTGGELVAVVSMDLETAVASVVAAEQVEGTPIEALKAQAVAARSYFVATRGRHRGFDFCDTTHCQFLREPPAIGRAPARAAMETAGLVLAFRGTPIAGLYSARCGGRTRSLVDAGLRTTDGYPYFAVECSYCVRHPNEWKRRLPLDADARQLDASRSEAARLTVDRRHGWSAVPGNNFEARQERDALVLHGRGAGHGIGLCQAGAAGLAAGDAATFAGILDHYYPGTTLARRSK